MAFHSEDGECFTLVFPGTDWLTCLPAIPLSRYSMPRAIWYANDTMSFGVGGLRLQSGVCVGSPLAATRKERR